MDRRRKLALLPGELGSRGAVPPAVRPHPPGAGPWARAAEGRDPGVLARRARGPPQGLAEPRTGLGARAAHLPLRQRPRMAGAAQTDRWEESLQLPLGLSRKCPRVKAVALEWREQGRVGKQKRSRESGGPDRYDFVVLEASSLAGA